MCDGLQAAAAATQHKAPAAAGAQAVADDATQVEGREPTGQHPAAAKATCSAAASTKPTASDAGRRGRKGAAPQPTSEAGVGAARSAHGTASSLNPLGVDAATSLTVRGCERSRQQSGKRKASEQAVAWASGAAAKDGEAPGTAAAAVAAAEGPAPRVATPASSSQMAQIDDSAIGNAQALCNADPAEEVRPAACM